MEVVAARTGTISASAASSSIVSAASRLKMKSGTETPIKHWILMQQHRDGGCLTSLAASFDTTAPPVPSPPQDDMMLEGDAELMSEEEMRAAASPQVAVEPVAQPAVGEGQQSSVTEVLAPAQTAEDAYWSRMEKRFQREQLHGGGSGHEARRRRRQGHDGQNRDKSTKRQEMCETLESKIEAVLQRVAKLEWEDNWSQSQTTPLNGDSWQPNQTIFGGLRRGVLDYIPRIVLVIELILLVRICA